LLLLSGGIDSPVAGHIMTRQGCAIDALHFSLQPFTDATAEEKSSAIAHMMGWKFFVCQSGEMMEKIVKSCAHRYYFVLSKRFMLRLAETFAQKNGCDCLVTGENLGQVSSQTLENLCVIDCVVSIPVLRPLIGYDKLEIVNNAKARETYEISCGPEVCDVLGPRHPAVASRLSAILQEESKLDMGQLVESALETIRQVNL
jgi:thiamine biosynthesis protein ThiI